MTAIRFAAILFALAVAMTACDSPSDTDDSAPHTVVASLSDSSVIVGQAIEAYAAAFDEDGDELPGTTWWSTSDPSIIHIDPSGYGEALAPGDVYVVAHAGAISDSVLLHVDEDFIVSLRIRPLRAPGQNPVRDVSEPYPVIGGVGRRFVVYGVYASGDSSGYFSSVAWSSTDPSIAIVDTAGFVSAESMGAAQIYVSASGLAGDTVPVVTIPGYDVTMLGFAAEGMNEVGQIVGNNGPTAVLWSDGVLTDLGQWTAMDINDAGDVVGWRRASTQRLAVVWRDGVLTDLPLLGQGSMATAINDSGVIVGGVDCHATLLICGNPARWSGDQLDTLGPGSGLLWGVDDAGTAVGVYGSAAHVAVVWPIDGAAFRPLEGMDARDRNAAGWTVGFSYFWIDDTPYPQATAWGPAGEFIRYYHPSASSAYFSAINDEGVMVGRLDPSGNQLWPFIVYPGLPLITLQDFVPDQYALRPTDPTDINNAGRILIRNLLLTPRPF